MQGKIVAANWKMHGNNALAHTLAAAVVRHVHTAPPCTVVLCPPAVYLHVVAGEINSTPVSLGGQDCHGEAQGAFTGDIAAPMLKEAGCSYVIVGHSERRQFHYETSAQVRAKAAQALTHGLVPIVCVGESLAEREAGKAMDVVARQVSESVPGGADTEHFVLAYEPIWAIGTGRTAGADDIASMHRHIVEQARGARVLYGGSVKPGNAGEIMRLSHVAGVLVGGASLVAEDFCRIIDSCHPERWETV